jgi:pimeloyl-ACP methyl ester carboxylesterase
MAINNNSFNQKLEKYYLLLSEAPRLGAQLTDTLLNLKDYENLERGNQIPTVVIPGFSAGNGSTFFMRSVLSQRNHNMIKWYNNRNIGFSDEVISLSIDQIKELADIHGTAVNIVGQSLGGCYARTIANAIPDHINVVVTMGSPITGLELVNPSTIHHYDITSGVVDAAITHHTEYLHTFYPNPPLPSTSIYSKSDGVVNWQHSILVESDLSESIEVDASHISMGFNLKTIKIIANRLAQKKDTWVKHT